MGTGRILWPMKRKSLIWLRIWSVRLAYAAARVLPVKRRVVLATGNIPAIRGDLAAIREEIARRDPTIPVVILLHHARGGRRSDG